jgi:hypothetical protein
MNLRSELLPAARGLLKLARKDPAQARDAMAKLSVDEQVATVCEAPLEIRGRVLDLVPIPEEVVPLIPEAELCFLCKQLGVQDASWILALATDEQIVACVDLDAWNGLAVDVEDLDHWFATLAESGDETLLRAARSLDPELLALYLRAHIDVVLKPSGDDDWTPADGAQTLEGQYYFQALRENDDIAALLKLVHILFQKDYWLYFRMMHSVREELSTELEEWALRWRTGRLEDIGFPSWDSSMRIYGHLRPDRLADVPLEPMDMHAPEWALPVWITDLPAVAGEQPTIFRAAAALEPDERSQFFYAFIALANKVAVADRRGLGDAETLPEMILKAANVSSLGLEHVASENTLTLEETLRRVGLERLFRVGVNLAPEGVRPTIQEDTDEADEADEGIVTDGGS